MGSARSMRTLRNNLLEVRYYMVHILNNMYLHSSCFSKTLAGYLGRWRDYERKHHNQSLIILFVLTLIGTEKPHL